MIDFYAEIVDNMGKEMSKTKDRLDSAVVRL